MNEMHPEVMAEIAGLKYHARNIEEWVRYTNKRTSDSFKDINTSGLVKQHIFSNIHILQQESLIYFMKKINGHAVDAAYWFNFYRPRFYVPDSADVARSINIGMGQIRDIVRDVLQYMKQTK